MLAQHPVHYCIFRTDRVGDVLLTLPMAEAIKRHDPASRVTFCVRSYVADLVRLSPWIDDLIEVGESDSTFAKDFSPVLRDASIDVALFAYPRPRLAFAAWRAWIPIRIGTANRWYSLFFNRRNREHRSRAEYHESTYNLHLLDLLHIPYDVIVYPRIEIPDQLDQEAIAMLEEIGLHEHSKFIVIHPGSGGSAKDWSADRFGSLGQKIADAFSEISVLVTGTCREKHLIQTVKQRITKNVYSFERDLTLKQFTAIISRAQCVVANSTGPLHIGAAAGIPVVGLYPNKKVCNPKRWGPLSKKAVVFTPPKIEGCSACDRNECEGHDRMEKIFVEEVYDACLKLLSKPRDAKPVSASAGNPEMRFG